MSYKELVKECNLVMEERLSMVKGRLCEIAIEDEIEAKYADYFKAAANYILSLEKMFVSHEDKGVSVKYSQDTITKVYEPVMRENYCKSYANPTYAVSKLGREYGQLFSAVFAKFISLHRYLCEGDITYLCIYSELLVELYGYFCDEPEPSVKAIRSCVYSFMHDYSEIFNEYSVNHALNPSYDYFRQLVENADLSQEDYLYEYGLYIGEDEKKSRKLLNKFSDEKIKSMADTYTEGYRIGFEVCNKDISKKKIVQIVYPIGFERIVRAAMDNFKEMGLEAILAPGSISANRQFDYDHKEDSSLWMDKAWVEYNIECYHNSLEKVKDIAPLYGGPAVIEVFGEEPFSPVAKADNATFSDVQQQLYVHLRSQNSQELYKYIHGEERSFTIIAYPISSIGEQYEAIFEETVKLNNLDYILYRDMQQKIIDVLDTADYVHIEGSGVNRTDLYIKIYDLQNPQKETAFENCVADVNIPVGEVFTTPVLMGTTGKLHVSQVYLNGLKYENLEIDFKDGMIENYTCTNFESEEANKKFIADNILFHHETLPMGEFAIGTNTTAYKMGRDFGIADKLPILIAEKTGPHFAVGDTCYSYDEDNMTYNPDGKAIVARDNSISYLRKTDVSKAYFNCHTDITIPYDELKAITVICKDKTTKDIIRDGRFVVEGTQPLNEPLEQMN